MFFLYEPQQPNLLIIKPQCPNNLEKPETKSTTKNADPVSYNHHEASSGRLPFAYLSLLVGASMRRVIAWKPVVEKFKTKLASWKPKIISFGNR